ncbi:hypothetical protein ACRYCC_04385 [Actinomadura scrupuli]|uniref:hypothetical protein n=1 Tax=Actinomadura scrupuli TaxID=559629 RepID=UPI003D994C57
MITVVRARARGSGWAWVIYHMGRPDRQLTQGQMVAMGVTALVPLSLVVAGLGASLV